MCPSAGLSWIVPQAQAEPNSSSCQLPTHLSFTTKLSSPLPNWDSAAPFGAPFASHTEPTLSPLSSCTCHPPPTLCQYFAHTTNDLSQLWCLHQGPPLSLDTIVTVRTFHRFACLRLWFRRPDHMRKESTVIDFPKDAKHQHGTFMGLLDSEI